MGNSGDMMVPFEALNISEIIAATGGKLLSGHESELVKSISTDSRKMGENCLFVPIVGEKLDGHQFIQSAFENGAACCIVHQDVNLPKDKTIISVDDTLKAFHALAKYYRQKFDIPFTAVTGSVGKTTTKEMIAAVLSQKYNILKTEGNFNNHIGLPLTLFGLNRDYQMGLVEMGMSDFGEIEALSKIAIPETAVVTNIGVAHIESLGTQQNILKAKLEILSGMKNDGHIVLNGDDPLLAGLIDLPVENVHYYSIYSKIGIYPYNIFEQSENGSRYMIKYNDCEYEVMIPSAGEHNIYNSLAAIQVGLIYNIPIDKIIEGIKDFSPGNMRQNIITVGSNIKVIEDCYNANPQSMQAAIGVLANVSAKRRIAVLGDMLELGELSGELHSQIGGFAAQKGIDYLFLVGKFKENVKNGAVESGMDEVNIFCFESNFELADKLNPFLASGDAVLVKGSRGMKMEQIVGSLREVK